MDSAGSYVPIPQRLRLPQEKKGVVVMLATDSFEYDIELIRNIPQPKTDYKLFAIPYRLITKIGGRPFRYLIQQSEYTKKVAYLNQQNKTLQPRLTMLRYPYPSTVTENLYVSMSELMKRGNQLLHQFSIGYLKEHFFQVFGDIIRPFAFGLKRKVIVVDTKRVKIYKNPTLDMLQYDLINGLICAYLLLNESKLPHLEYTIIFKSGDADYKFDLRQFNKNDAQRLRSMLNKFGVEAAVNTSHEEEPEEDVSTTDEEEKNELAETPEEDANIVAANEIVKQKETVQKTSNDGIKISEKDMDIQSLQNSHQSVVKSLQASIEKISMNHKNTDSELNDVDNEDLTNKASNKQQLYAAKAFDINASLMQKINPDTSVVNSYKHLADDITPVDANSVEKQLIQQASKKIENSVSAPNVKDVNRTITNPREEKLRNQIGQLKLNNVTFDKLTSVNDVPKPTALKPLHLTTTSRPALRATGFTNIAKEYEDKLMDRDIVATLMTLSKPSDGFYVTNVEVTDISTCVSMLNNWKVSLKNKQSGLTSTVNIVVPKMLNGRYYYNGTWYSIDKQEFPIPVLKIDPKTVMITSNYNKITVARYDTKSLVDVSAMLKTVNKLEDENGKNRYIKPGSSVNSNAHYISTIEYDEYAKVWYSFTNREQDCEIVFNRNECLKMWQFVAVNANEFCCGMINKVPVIVNTETGLTRQGITLTETILQMLPPDVQQTYIKTKPGKTSMYSTIKIGNTVPLGVAICAWEGLNSLLKNSNCKYKIVDQRFRDPHYIVFNFKNKSIAIENTIGNQLLFNGLYRINTKAYDIEEFETPIMESNSVYVDIFNQLFFTQYSQLTTFITYYNFFMDAITYDVCNHYNLPNTLIGLLIYSSNLLVDNSAMSENNASLYRVRSSEIIPAMIHYHLAVAMSNFNNRTGSRARANKLQFNPNCIMKELTDTQTIKCLTALNPMVELHARETISKKGFRGVNNDRAYTETRRSFEDSMVGKLAISSPNSANVGIARQLVADPKIESVRGYTSTDGIDADYDDLQLASFSELLTPGSVSRDDAIRTAIGTSQTSHTVSTADAQPVLISNGMDEIVPAYLTEQFSVMAEEDGTVIELSDGYMIVQYKSGKKKAINIDHKYAFNDGGGFYVDNKLTPNYQAGDKFKRGEILAYHEKFFSKDSTGQVRMNVGPLAKVAFMGCYSTYEDSGVMTTKMSKRLATKVTMREIIKLDCTEDIEKIVHVGDEVEIGDPLLVFGLGNTGDKSVDNFLRAFGGEEDSFKRTIDAKHAGTIVDVRMYTNKAMDKLSPSLYNILSGYFTANKKKRKILDKHDKSNAVYKLDTLFSLPTEPLKTPSLKGINTDVLIEVYIEHEDDMSVGDKLTNYSCMKQICSEVIPEGLEPYAESTPDEEISVFQAPSSILKRMVPSVVVTAAGNKVLVNLKRQVQDIWENS
jgi:hypothetical protein